MSKALDKMREISDDRALEIFSMPENRHATVNDTIVANSAAHAIAHRSTESVAREGFKTVRHQLSMGNFSEDEGWDTFIKVIMVIGGIGLAGYLIYRLTEALKNQPQQTAQAVSQIKSGTMV